MKGKIKKIILWSITAIMAISASIYGIGSYANVRAEETIDGKELIENADGTYTLSLSVTGASEKRVNKANVVVVLDISGSMDYGTSYYKNNQGGYGIVNGEYEFLYYLSGGWNSSYKKIGNGTYNGRVYYAGSDGYVHEYYGDRYSATETRLDAAKRSVNNLANSLLKNNTTENTDIIEIALVTFSTKANTSQNATTSYDTFSSTVNGLTANGGTNWEAALKQAKNVSFGTNDNDTTYVIFVSDGNPTFHETDGGYNNYDSDDKVYGSGKEEEPNITRSYDQAKDDAKALVTDGYQFYTIGIYGNVDRMKDLTTYSGVSASTNYFSASDTQKLEEALDTILKKIETAGIGDVTIADGTTQSVSTNSGDLNLLTIDYTDQNNNSFKYWLSIPVTANGNGGYTGTINNKPANVTANGNGGYTLTWGDNGEYSLDGVVKDDKFKYEWTDANDLVNEAAPKATLTNSKVNWDLSGLGTLLNGVTYTVTFDVWPSQTTYDLISDLNNGIVKYSDLDSNVRDYLKSDDKGGYTLLTNTRATLTYTDTRVSNEKQTAVYTNPDPVGTGVSEMTVKKLWDNNLDAHHNDVKKVRLNVLKDGSNYGDTIELDDSTVDIATGNTKNKWEEKVFISTGLMSINRDNNGNVVSAIIREKGHNYTFEEIEDGTYYWDLAVETVRPMLVNGEDGLVLKTFVKVKDNAPTIGDSNVTTIDGVTYYKIDGSVYYIREENSAIMNATNVRRSNLNITKVVTGKYAPEDALFTFKLTVNDYNKNDVWFSIYDPKNGTVTDDKYVSASNLNKEYKNGSFTGYYYVKSGTEITVEMKANWNIRFTNLATGSTYSFEETNMPDNFAFVSATGTEVTASIELLPEGAIDNGNGTYTFNNVIYTKVENNGDVYYTYVGKANINSEKVDGKIYVGNTSYTVTYTNDYLKTEVSGEKVWKDNNDQDGKRPDEIEVKLIAKVDGEEVSDLSKTTKVTPDKDNKWYFKFSDLNRYYEGKTIDYSIEEISVEGYKTNITTDKDGNYVITNTHDPEKISVSGTKTWNDSATDTNRPDEINIVLTGKIKEEVVYTESKKVSKDDNWNYSFTGLDKYKNGVEITYSVKEDKVTGYTTTYDNYNIINTLDTTSLVVNKVWDDKINTSNRPNDITIELYANKELYTSVKLNSDNEWKHEFTDLPKYISGKEITYSVKEISVIGYESIMSKNDNGYTFTNKLLTTSVSGVKTWSDNNNQDGKRPDEIIVNLLANGAKFDSTKATKEGNWKYEFTDLPKYISGKEVTYSVSEEAVDGYTPSINGYNIKNTHEIEKVSVNTVKVWNDNNNQDGKRPANITINLLANGKKVDTCVTDSTKNYACSFTNLDKYASGKEISYTVTEEAVDGYTTSIDGYTITNSYDPEKTAVNTIKVWDDNNNQDGKRPANITINLLANGEKVDTCVTDSTKNYACSFTNLDKYASGKEISYTITEEKVDGYTTSINGYIITNKHEIEKTSVEGKKSWVDNNDAEGFRPESITVRLMAGDKEIAKNTVKPNDKGEWNYSFTNLDKYADGKEIEYTVKEDKVDNYETSYDKENPFIIVNTHNSKELTMSVKKVWVDESIDGIKNIYGHNDSIEVRLVGKVGENVYHDEKVTLSNENEWTYTFTNLPEYREGKLISYSFEELTDVKNYSVKITNNGNEYTITNTYSPKTISIDGEKTWVDSDDNDGIRPDSIELVLTDNYKNEIARKNVTKEDNWKYEFENLPMYDNDGKEIVYTLSETSVTGYVSEIKDYNVTNTHTLETVSFNITKVWNDNNNNDGIRPESITVRLMANGSEVASAVISEATKWAYEFENLNKYANGELINYTIVEDEVSGYTSKVNKSNDNSFEVVNTHIDETKEITITKTWDDMDDISEIRPSEITVYLYADGVLVNTLTITKEDNWEMTVIGLPKYNNGKEIVYTIDEKEVFEYETIIDGYNITNKHELGIGGGPEEEPPQTGVTYTKNNSIVYMILMLLSIISINVMIFKEN